jgi:ADP-ribosyl-[dinitrogen reductase] hydrolase
VGQGFSPADARLCAPYTPRMTIPVADRIRGALLGLACGDALGAPAEFKSAATIRQEYGTLRDMVGGGVWMPGEWTDDTGMALAVAEGILEAPADPVSAIGRNFLEWRRTAKDVGNTVRAALDAYAGDWAAASAGTSMARSGHAGGNGSLMRTLPVALAYAGREQMLRESARISAMTHWDAQAEVCCRLYCLWIRELLADDRPAVAEPARRAELWQSAVRSAEDHVAAHGRLAPDSHGPSPLPVDFWPRVRGMAFTPLADLQPTGYAGFVVDCLEAAVACVVQGPSLEEVIVTLVNLGGEADTMAAVAGGAAGAYWGVQGIPARWLDVLHQRERLERVAAEVVVARK